MDSHNNELGLKTCSTCGQSKPLTDFYSKGNRSDSACKPCVRIKKKAGYQSQATDKELVRVKKVASLICEFQMEQLTKFHDQLKTLITKAEKRTATTKEPEHENRQAESQKQV